MTLEDIYKQLQYGELRDIVLGSGPITSPETEEDLGMQRAAYEKILPSVQLGITELHKRFFLREGRASISLALPEVSYVVEPADDNLFKIERVYGTWDGEQYEIPLNRLGDRGAIRTLNYRTLLIPDDPAYAPWLDETSTLEIVYRADHPKIEINVANGAPMVVEIELPSLFMEPLVWYVASRLHNNQGIQGETFHAGNNYAAKFEASVQQIKDMNFEIDDDAVNQRPIAAGWV